MAVCLDVSTNASFVSSSWGQRWCICVCTSCVQFCLLGVGGPAIYPTPLNRGLRPVTAVGSNSTSKHPTQPPWISMLFPPGDFRPPPHITTSALPPRPQCLSPPGPRCSKLVPAQSFIDFKIEANSSLKTHTYTHNEARERQSPRLEGEDSAETGPESERDRERQRQSQI